MNSTTAPHFWQHYRKLPAAIRQAAREAYRQFLIDPAYPGLHFHRLATDSELWSVRVTRSYRAVGLFQGDTITWFWIGNHDEFDKAFPR